MCLSDHPDRPGNRNVGDVSWQAEADHGSTCVEHSEHTAKGCCSGAKESRNVTWDKVTGHGGVLMIEMTLSNN